jgi:hypothetical protein
MPSKDLQKHAQKEKEQEAHGNVLFPTPDDRREACQAYIDHLEQGYSKNSFELCSPETIAKYMQNFPEEFDNYEIAKAYRRGMLVWEGIGMSLAMGTTSGNGQVYFRTMMNQYGWRNEVTVDEPEKYKTPQIDFSKMSDDDLAKLSAIIDKAEMDDVDDVEI